MFRRKKIAVKPFFISRKVFFEFVEIGSASFDSQQPDRELFGNLALLKVTIWLQLRGFVKRLGSYVNSDIVGNKSGLPTGCPKFLNLPDSKRSTASLKLDGAK